MQIEITIKGIEEALKKFDTRIVQKAVETTLIRTAKFGKTEISKQISSGSIFKSRILIRR